MLSKTIDTMTLQGGDLSLDFVNTIDDRKIDERHDYLNSYQDLLLWLKKTNGISNNDINALKKESRTNKTEAQRAFKRLITVRENLHSIFTSIISDQSPDHITLAGFNTFLSKGLNKLSLQIDKKGVREIRKSNTDLDLPFYPVMKAAYNLLTSENLSRIKECSSCGWIFLDKSKNNSRKWCSMQFCGSADKAKRYYRKKKKLS